MSRAPYLEDRAALRAWGAQQLTTGFGAGLLFAQLVGLVIWALT